MFLLCAILFPSFKEEKITVISAVCNPRVSIYNSGIVWLCSRRLDVNSFRLFSMWVKYRTALLMMLLLLPYRVCPDSYNILMCCTMHSQV